jgi:hypothetical protein
MYAQVLTVAYVLRGALPTLCTHFSAMSRDSNVMQSGRTCVCPIRLTGTRLAERVYALSDS